MVFLLGALLSGSQFVYVLLSTVVWAN